MQEKKGRGGEEKRREGWRRSDGGRKSELETDLLEEEVPREDGCLKGSELYPSDEEKVSLFDPGKVESHKEKGTNLKSSCRFGGSGGVEVSFVSRFFSVRSFSRLQLPRSKQVDGERDIRRA